MGKQAYPRTLVAGRLLAGLESSEVGGQDLQGGAHGSDLSRGHHCGRRQGLVCPLAYQRL